MQARTSGHGSILSHNEVSPEPFGIRACEIQPDADAIHTPQSTSNAGMLSVEEMLAMFIAESPATHVTNIGRVTLVKKCDQYLSSSESRSVDIEPSSKYSPPQMSERERGVEVADFLLAEGRYDEAYRLYSCWLDVLWTRDERFVADQFLVHSTGNISRAASTSVELLDVGAKIRQLFDDRVPEVFDTTSKNRAVLLLHINLGILSLRLQQPREAARYFQYALSTARTFRARYGFFPGMSTPRLART